MEQFHASAAEKSTGKQGANKETGGRWISFAELVPTQACFRGAGVCLYVLYESVSECILNVCACLWLCMCFSVHTTHYTRPYGKRQGPDPDHDNRKQMSLCQPAAQHKQVQLFQPERSNKSRQPLANITCCDCFQIIWGNLCHIKYILHCTSDYYSVWFCRHSGVVRAWGMWRSVFLHKGANSLQYLHVYPCGPAVTEVMNAVLCSYSNNKLVL